jgi:hypothetical protein
MRLGGSVLAEWLRHLYARFRGGTASFNGAEKRILTAVLEQMPEPDRSTLEAQIRVVALVQRQHPGRLVVAYYRHPDRVPPLPYPGYEYCLAKVKFKTGAKARTTALVLHNGRFMSFERNVPRFEDEIESLVGVQMHPGQFRAVADQIDQSEHAGNAA